VFTAHSVPLVMADASGPPADWGLAGSGGRYVAELTEACRLIADRIPGPGRPWQLVYQSRSGPPSQPWLEPDVVDHLGDLAKQGAPGAVIIPVGFVSDHMEVQHDLDTEAAEAARELGLPLARAATPWYHPQFRELVVDLVRERLEDRPYAARAALGPLGPSTDECPAGCCVFSRPGART
jgi:ferrochelatase